jgi:hypothetical protein
VPISRIQHENCQQIEEGVEEAGGILDDEFDEVDEEYNLVAGRKLEERVKRSIQMGETAFENIKQSVRSASCADDIRVQIQERRNRNS